MQRSNGWTGGQYSLYRAVFGVTLGIRVATGPAPLPAMVGGLVAALLFTLGFGDRIAAIAMLGILPVWCGVHPGGLAGALWLTLLALHLAVPTRPYGALSMRGRLDPGGGWRLGWPVPLAFLLAFATAHAGIAIFTLTHDALPEARPWLAYLQLAATAALLPPQSRPFAWCALSALVFVAPPPIATLDAVLLFVPLHLSAFDPAWLPPRRRAAPLQVFYDGHCGLCHRFVRLCLAEDPTGDLLRFAPLQGETFAAVVPAAQRANLPDSFAVQAGSDPLRLRSTAAIFVLDTLGGLWRVAAALMWLAPRPLRDLVYDGIARIRRHLFAAPAEACPILPPALRSRFGP